MKTSKIRLYCTRMLSAALLALGIAVFAALPARATYCPAHHSAAQKSSQRAAQLAAQGNHYLVDDEFAKALPLLKQAVALAPRNVEAWRDLGVCLSQMGRKTDAISAYRISDRLKPNDEMTLNNLAIALNAVGKHAEAVAVAHRAIKASGNDPNVVDTMNRHILHP